MVHTCSQVFISISKMARQSKETNKTNPYHYLKIFKNFISKFHVRIAKEYHPTIQPHIFEKSMWQSLPKFQNHPNLHPQIFRNSMWQPTEKIEKPMWYLVGIFEKSICGRPPEFCVFRPPSLFFIVPQNGTKRNRRKRKK